MPQVSKNKLSPKIHKRIDEIFLNCFSKLNNNSDIQFFLNDILTPTERKMITKRVAIAYLYELNYDYRSISFTIKVSTATVNSVINKYSQSEKFQKNIKQLVKNEKFNQNLQQLIGTLTGVYAINSSKSGAWKEINKKIKDKEKPF